MEKDLYPAKKGEGTTVLKTIKLAQPIVKPAIEEPDIPSPEVEADQPKVNIINKFFNKLKNITYELFKRP
ncbi:hypothetical protein [Chryseobacterium sp. CT-SW4]|uniref:hypothetical protein n=1 Tax=Chryseobacterium sp. SW-1 TaxID=3157343 RepID=UPI003B02D578